MKKTILSAAGTLLIVAALAAGCGEAGEQGDPEYTFDPVLVSTFQLATETEAGPDDWVAPFLVPGESYTVELYEVPGFPCVRMDTDDLSELPEGAQIPGAPAVFVIVHPDAATGIDRGLMYYPHGYGNEGLERAAVTIYNEDRQLYDSLENFQPELTELFVGQTTAGGGIEANMTGITDAEIAELNAALQAAGQDPLDISSQGIVFEDGVNGWAFRVYGGLSFNIFWLKIDPSLMYNFIDQTVGFQASVRLQF